MDPTRLRDDPSQPAALRELIEQSTRDVGSSAEVAKTAAKLSSVIGASAVGLTAAGGVAKASILTKVGVWLAAGVVVAGAGAIVVQQTRSEPAQQAAPATAVTHVAKSQPVAEPEPPAAVEPTAQETAIEEPATDEAATAEPAVPVPVKRKALATAAQPSALQPSLQASAPAPGAQEPPAPPPPSETQLLAAAQAALNGNPARALQLTAQHQKLYPSGGLTQERQVLEIDALYRLGRSSEADARAKRFIAQHPGSSYARRVKDLMDR